MFQITSKNDLRLCLTTKVAHQTSRKTEWPREGQAKRTTRPKLRDYVMDVSFDVRLLERDAAIRENETGAYSCSFRPVLLYGSVSFWLKKRQKTSP